MLRKYHGIRWEDFSLLEKEQVVNLEKKPSIKEIEFFPDFHFGYTFPIGTITKTSTDVIYPSGVGVDIYCGVRIEFLEGVFKKDLLQKKNEIKKELYNFLKNQKNFKQDQNFEKNIEQNFESFFHASIEKKVYIDESLKNIKKFTKVKDNFLKQIGTLGGGNHFIEIFEEEGTGRIGISVHSGSRGLGASVIKNFSETITKKEEKEEYLKKYYTGCAFAILNRKLLIEKIKLILIKIGLIFKATLWTDIPHNFFKQENKNNFFYKGVQINKKELNLVVLGNMVEGSLLFQGTDNFRGICHGAGRAHSRKKMWKKPTFLHTGIPLLIMNKKSLVEEQPSAYKNIEQIKQKIESQKMGKFLCKTTPIFVIKE